MWSQIATSKIGRGGTQYLPYAFTDHGVLQIANLINTELADSVSIFVIRAFEEMVGQYTTLPSKLEG